jgi:two-component system capsular synthesis sensor histidine kinase RcsC
MSNALKFTKKGFIELRVRLSNNIIGAESESGINRYLFVEVQDTGIGIEDHNKCKLFSMFGKLKATNKVNPTGLGFGLNICKNLVE